MEQPLDLTIRKSTSPVINNVATEIGYDSGINDCRSPSTGLIDPEEVASDVMRQHGDIKVSLSDANVWKAFNDKGTEMIINRGGRRMFPHVTITVSGLSPSGLYNIWLEIVPADDRRYRYVQNVWISVSQADPSQPSPRYLHHHSPNTGSFWMQKKVSFARLKLTNNRDSSEGNILLQSMHKYKARIHITETGVKGHDDADSAIFNFDVTAFMAVTAYQNGSITKLKIHNNPFAKAFRDKHLSLNQKRHRKSSNSSEEEHYTDHIRRKGKQCGSDSVRISPCFSHALQLDSPTGRFTVSPWELSGRVFLQGEQPPKCPYFLRCSQRECVISPGMPVSITCKNTVICQTLHFTSLQRFARVTCLVQTPPSRNPACNVVFCSTDVALSIPPEC